MKKHLSLIIILTLITSMVYAQNGFSVEANMGPTLGEVKKLKSTNTQVNLYYLWSTSENVNLGLTAGISIFSGEGTDEVTLPNFFDAVVADSFIPIALAGRFNLSEKFVTGADIGFAFNDTVDGGGFIFKPIAMYYLGKKIAITLSYTSINEKGTTYSSINLGINVGF